MNLKQFNIVLVNLNPTIGSEQTGEARPCIILQTNASGNYGKTTIIAPLTSQIKKVYPFEVLLKKKNNLFLKEDSKVKFDQIRVIDKKRIVKIIGHTSDKNIQAIDEAMHVIFDLRKDFR